MKVVAPKTLTTILLPAMLRLAGIEARGQDQVTSFLAIPGDAQVTLTWAPASQASSYNVKQGRSVNGPFTTIATNVPGSSYVVNNLTNNQVYFFAVSSVADEFESANTPGLSATPSAAVLDLLPAGAKMEVLASGFQTSEGPVWNSAQGGFLIFSDLDGNRMLRWTPGSGITTFRRPSNRANGNTLDLQGRLLTCQQTTRSVTRAEPDGTITPLVTQYKAKPFNEPNDVVVKSDGTGWFTDPRWSNPTQTQPGQYVYRFDLEVGNPSVTLVATNTLSPNELCFSPDEAWLYVADTLGPASQDDEFPGLIWVYDVLPDNSLANGQVFFPCLSCFNVCLGGANQEMLFVTVGTSLYAITRMPDHGRHGHLPHPAQSNGRSASDVQRGRKEPGHRANASRPGDPP
jgi:sugar lactone lactonase YvrE